MLKELGYGKSCDITKEHNRLYKIDYYDTDKSNYKMSVYDKNGNAIMPFSDKFVSVFSNNVIRESDQGYLKYYDITGNPINSFNIVVFYDKYKFSVNFIAVIILTVLLCLIAHFCYKMMKKRGIIKSIATKGAEFVNRIDESKIPLSDKISTWSREYLDKL